MNTHLRGRPHQFNLDKHRSALRSVYVRGFPKHSSAKDDLQALFEQFGKVRKIWLPGNFVSTSGVLIRWAELIYHGMCCTCTLADFCDR